MDLALKKNNVALKIVDDKDMADSDTLESLQHLFLKEMKKKYSENRFSHESSKKKKKLTEAELELKRDFDSLVREVLSSLSIENLRETLDFLEEYYSELMSK